MLGSSSLHSASELGGLPPELLPPWAWKQTGPNAKYPKSPTASMAGWAFYSRQGWNGIYRCLSSPAAGTKILGELGEHSESCSSSGLAGRAETPMFVRQVYRRELHRGLSRTKTWMCHLAAPKPSLPAGCVHPSLVPFAAAAAHGTGTRALQPAPACVMCVLCSTAVLEAAHKSHCCFI